MNQEMIDLLNSLYRLELVKALYDQRIIEQEDYKKFLIDIAGNIIDEKPKESSKEESNV